MQDLIEVSAEERDKIMNLAEFLNNKWRFRTASRENLQEFAYEATSRYAEIGFLVNVDITPSLVGIGSPDISIVGKISSGETDHDRIRHEVKKQYEQDGRLRKSR
jgi:hypothetical protein